MITLEELKKKNEAGELPTHFTDEDLQKIIEAESMPCGGGCAFCPMAQYEFMYSNGQKKDNNFQKNDIKDSSNKTEK